MKLICLVVLGLLMACVGQAEEVVLKYGNRAVQFDIELNNAPPSAYIKYLDEIDGGESVWFNDGSSYVILASIGYLVSEGYQNLTSAGIVDGQQKILNDDDTLSWIKEKEILGYPGAMSEQIHASKPIFTLEFIIDETTDCVITSTDWIRLTHIIDTIKVKKN